MIREELALSTAKPNFEMFDAIVKKFDAHYELWMKISGMMTNKQKWQECYMKDIKVSEVDATIKESMKTL